MRTWIDHLVIAAADLDAAVAWYRSEVGADAVAGGAHRGRGTHNALAALGAPTYLELIAPDPAQPAPAGPRPFGLDAPPEDPTLVAFAVGTDDLDAAVAACRAAGIEAVGEPFAMSRDAPGGETLSWRLAMIGAGPAGPVPFLIEWGTTTSPAATAPAGPRLAELRGRHPDADGCRRLLAALAIDVPVEAAPAPSLTAVLAGPAGVLVRV